MKRQQKQTRTLLQLAKAYEVALAEEKARAKRLKAEKAKPSLKSPKKRKDKIHASKHFTYASPCKVTKADGSVETIAAKQPGKGNGRRIKVPD